MKSSFTSKIGMILSLGVGLILLLIPFHAFLSVWGASILGHYTLLRLWKEILLIPLGALAIWQVFRRRELRQAARNSMLLRLMLVYVLVQLLLGAAAYALHQVNRPALGEGIVEDTRLMVIFFVAWVAAGSSPWLRSHWKQLVLIPATAVVLFGLLQAFVLPAGFLSHFGYSSATIQPYETVDQNGHFIRIQSTLRGPNPLGAYLVVIIATLVCLAVPLYRNMEKRHKELAFLGVAGLATLTVMYFSYSRSALLGAAVTVFGIVWLSFKSHRIRRWTLAAVFILTVLIGGTALILRHNSRVEDMLFHTSQLSRSPQSSNQSRASALENGLHDVLREPFGRGPGTAGPASEKNYHPARIAENYYLQIGQETGWLGLGLFIAISVLIAIDLWRRRYESDYLPFMLLTSLIGLTVINMLSHAWADDTLAYLWWGLAGIALTPIIKQKQNKLHGKTAKKTVPEIPPKAHSTR